MEWAKDDVHLYSSGTSGLIFKWNMRTGERTEIIQIKGPAINKMSLSWDNQTIIYVVEDNESLREWSSSGNKFSDESPYYGAVAITKSNKMIFAGIKDQLGNAGSIRYFRNPIAGPFADYFYAHDHRGVENILITPEDKFLLSTGADGTIMMFNITDKEGRGGTLGEGFKQPCNNIMVTRQETEDLGTVRDNLIAQLNDENSPHSNSLDVGGRIDDTIKGLKDEIQTQQIGNQKRYKETLQEKTRKETKKKKELNELKQLCEKELKDLDVYFTTQLSDQQENMKDLIRQTEEVENLTREKFEEA